MSTTKKPARTADATRTPAGAFDGFSDEERAAMKEHAQELKKAARRSASTAKEDGEADLLAKVAAMNDSDRAMAERIHALVKANAPDLTPRTWYGMPAYAKGGKVVCFFQPAAKFKSRYASLGFNDSAALDDGPMWPVCYALTQVTAAEEARIAELLRKAAG